MTEPPQRSGHSLRFVSAARGSEYLDDPPIPGSATANWEMRPLYHLYERRLLRQVRRLPIPRHIGIILDGNRRHGERPGIRDPREIYGLGAGKLDDVLNWWSDLGVAAVTLGVFSTENLERPVDQVSGISQRSKQKSVRSLMTRRSTGDGSGCRRSASLSCCRDRLSRQSGQPKTAAAA